MIVNHFSKSHFVVLEIQYPELCGSENLTGLIIFCKSSLTGDEVPELVELADKSNNFPHDPTSDQFLDPDQFESYLELGRHIGDCVDDFVLNGNIDKFDIPLDWHSRRTRGATVCKQATGLSENDELANDKKKDDQFLTTMADELKFETNGIKQVLKHFNQLLKDHADQDSQTSLDSSEFESLVFWVREQLASDYEITKDSRQLFCDGLAEMVHNHKDRIKLSAQTLVSFFLILELVGSRIKGVSNTLKLLAEEQEQEEEKEQGST